MDSWMSWVFDTEVSCSASASTTASSGSGSAARVCADVGSSRVGSKASASCVAASKSGRFTGRVVCCGANCSFNPSAASRDLDSDQHY